MGAVSQENCRLALADCLVGHASLVTRSNTALQSPRINCMKQDKYQVQDPQELLAQMKKLQNQLFDFDRMVAPGAAAGIAAVAAADFCGF